MDWCPRHHRHPLHPLFLPSGLTSVLSPLVADSWTPDQYHPILSASPARTSARLCWTQGASLSLWRGSGTWSEDSWSPGPSPPSLNRRRIRSPSLSFSRFSPAVVSIWHCLIRASNASLSLTMTLSTVAEENKEELLKVLWLSSLIYLLLLAQLLLIFRLVRGWAGLSECSPCL